MITWGSKQKIMSGCFKSTSYSLTPKYTSSLSKKFSSNFLLISFFLWTTLSWVALSSIIINSFLIPFYRPSILDRVAMSPGGGWEDLWGERGRLRRHEDISPSVHRKWCQQVATSWQCSGIWSKTLWQKWLPPYMFCPHNKVSLGPMSWYYFLCAWEITLAMSPEPLSLTPYKSPHHQADWQQDNLTGKDPHLQWENCQLKISDYCLQFFLGLKLLCRPLEHLSST